MTVALIHPPLTDPTMPYVAVPLLGAVLRREGHEVLTIDANLEAVEHLLKPAALEELRERVEARWRRLDGLPGLGHTEQIEWGILYDALVEAGEVPSRIPQALDVLRDRTGLRFADTERYAEAVAQVQGALEIIAAAHHPLELDFARFRTPFSWLSPAEIANESAPGRDPFRPWTLDVLAPRLRRARARFVGISVAFPGQLQPAWSLAAALRAELPGLYLVVGGPAVTQRLAPLERALAEEVLGPFDAAVLFEGERALVDLVEAHGRGAPRRGVIRGEPLASLGDLPAPDYDGLPLGRYLAPEPVLPYDASRGCPWNRCAFCHYGLAEQGTAKYRERPLPMVARDLRVLASRHGARLFYLSQDSMSLRLALGLARELAAGPERIHWASDMRPERGLTPEGARTLAAGGCLALSLGVESGAPRVLELIDKGVTVGEIGRVIRTLAAAGIAVEAMVFTDFPTETTREALATLAFLEEHRREIALFTCGHFDLTAGSRVARNPARYGVEEIFHVAGDRLGTGLFFREARRRPGPAERERVEAALGRLSGRYAMRPYPWAGSLSTAHSLLQYLRHGPGVFRLGGVSAAQRGGTPHSGHAQGRERPPSERAIASRYNPTRVQARARAREERIWDTLIYERREVSREAYDDLAQGESRARPSLPARDKAEARRPRRPRRPRTPRRHRRGTPQ